MKENVLSGENWYSIQAYRAINQALGRCIRHKDDWGAIVLLESRFTEYEKRKGLSKWLRDRVEVRQDFTEGMGELEKFVQNRMELDKEAQEKEKLAKAKLKEEAMKKEESTYNISDAYIPPDGHQQIPLQMPVAYTVNPGCPYYFPYQGNTTMDQQAFIPYSQISGSSHSLSYMGNVGALPAISQYRPYHNPLIGNATPSQTTIPPAHTPVQYFPILVNKQVPGEHSFIQERIDPPPTLDALLQTSVESIIKSTMSSISKSEANLSQCDSNYRQFKKHQSYSVASSQPMIEETSPFSYPVYRAKTEPVLPLSVATNIVESPYFVKSPVREAPKPAQTEVSKPSHVQEPILAEEPPKPAYAEEVSKPVCAEKVLEHNHLETSASSAPTKKDILPKETTDLYPEHSNVDSFSIAGIPSEQFQRPEPNQDRQSTDGSPTVLIQGEGSFEDLDAAFEDDFDFSVSDVCIEESQTMANISPRDFRPGAVERVYCNKCQTVLMTGDQSHLVISSQSVWDCGTQLSTAQGPMWEVQYPERWISLLCIDPAKMPNETQVYMNKKDQLFYQKMHCGCDEWVGIFVCGAMKPEQEAQIGTQDRDNEERK
ncbi:hypothetical protein BY458DRAFT_72309 [Sporodiniella umbellata]|nr:hypothetical protein BY458DRAFT_72309 [Sporodiniella umbellata]